mmetsp:Transcript_23609/g.78437  ORF Transcript_23609/g.78437 Transcript_23609/m.78437 type:complete len:237 (+) Transcript_23609:258-968(+)
MPASVEVEASRSTRIQRWVPSGSTPHSATPFAMPRPHTAHRPPSTAASPSPPPTVRKVPPGRSTTAYERGAPPSMSMSIRHRPTNARLAKVAGRAGRALRRRSSRASRSPRPSEPMSASARVRSHSPTWHGSSAPSRTAPPSCVHRRPVRSPTARMVQSLTRSETVTRCCADSVGALSAHQTPSSFSSRPRTLPLAASRHVSVRSPSSRRSSAFHTPERASSSSGSRDPSAAVRAT